MDYTFTACLITAIISAWIGAFVVYKIGKDHYARAKFFMDYADGVLKQTDHRNQQIQSLTYELDKALSNVAKLERKLGQVVHAQEEFAQAANKAVEAASQRAPLQPILAPQVTDERVWKALLLACDALARGPEENEPSLPAEVWTQHLLEKAGTAG